jgi:hypothetical protein
MKYVTHTCLVLLLAAAAFVAAGCGQENKDKQVQGDKKEVDKDKEKVGTKHDKWWCEEHGIPEAECIMCSEKLTKEAKAKGDWCKHNRARSQCFECDPKLKEEYAAKYRAKYPGKEPPPPTDYD